MFFYHLWVGEGAILLTNWVAKAGGRGGGGGGGASSASMVSNNKLFDYMFIIILN